ncbi:type II toxin-antitoxin system RelE/ParE family toxin [Aureimonas psammosilenae]|uniref:type II toxin-antitoxin system RelE/ParE family toxin n=1 Tax=Aureimonas psammosilenae TaxID=2495496 RepID=UPI001869E696|nr:type II toxin-antitoxin system RelE/ParE family toxin [Aureimonas psammosilenae]
MSVSYAETAVAEIEEILDFLKERSPSAAASLRGSLQEIEQRLASHPLTGSPVSARGQSMRRLVVQPYLLFYRVSGPDVLVVGLRHAARHASSMPS